ncbi:MAG: IS21 family transposase [Polyangiales bacterium]
MITAELRADIRRKFFGEHWKVGTIASTLGVHHETVARAIEVQRFANSRHGVRLSGLDDFKPFIGVTLEQYPRLNATRVYEMIRARGYDGGVHVVRRYVRDVRPEPKKEAFFRLSTLPGEQAQVDWGSFGKIRVGNSERDLSCFVMVLSYSRIIFARFVLDMTMESFLRCHEAAFASFGGTARSVLYDNLKTVVLERIGDVVRFHPRMLEFAGHYHFAPVPVGIARGNEKGRVERAIRYLRESFFAARRYRDLADLNAQLERWIEDVADARPHRPDDSRTVSDVFAAEERDRLLALPANRFPCDHVQSVRSGKTPYVRFDRNDYSIPHTLIRKPLTLVASETTVRILDGSEEVATHARSWERLRQIESTAHLDALAREKGVSAARAPSPRAPDRGPRSRA